MISVALCLNHQTVSLQVHSDFYSYYIVNYPNVVVCGCKNDNGGYTVFICVARSDFICSTNSETGSITLTCSDGSSIIRDRCYGSLSTIENYTYFRTDGGGTSLSISNGLLFYSNNSVYDTSGNVVFPQAPAQGEQQQGETQGIQTLTLEQAEQIPQAMTQTLRVVIPVGLVVFGIGLVIFLTRFLILRLM